MASGTNLVLSGGLIVAKKEKNNPRLILDTCACCDMLNRSDFGGGCCGSVVGVRWLTQLGLGASGGPSGSGSAL